MMVSLRDRDRSLPLSVTDDGHGMSGGWRVMSWKAARQTVDLGVRLDVARTSRHTYHPYRASEPPESTEGPRRFAMTGQLILGPCESHVHGRAQSAILRVTSRSRGGGASAPHPAVHAGLTSLRQGYGGPPKLPSEGGRPATTVVIAASSSLAACRRPQQFQLGDRPEEALRSAHLAQPDHPRRARSKRDNHARGLLAHHDCEVRKARRRPLHAASQAFPSTEVSTTSRRG